ncbi:Cytochrome c-2 [Apis cerana cerana]|uniref:Cytochrome c-2 n=1 Tax=Apis cerana cerana TaxID=94128 RepID=A0A2A3E7Q7_APICC|nr:Cytochrome c-2 [Apis cerana cerana]
MKYSPQQQQQQQKERKSESDVCSIDTATPNRGGGGRRQSTSTECKNFTSTSSRSAICRSPSTGMFAWMRVFRLASMLHQINRGFMKDALLSSNFDKKLNRISSLPFRSCTCFNLLKEDVIVNNNYEAICAMHRGKKKKKK